QMEGSRHRSSKATFSPTCAECGTFATLAGNRYGSLNPYLLSTFRRSYPQIGADYRAASLIRARITYGGTPEMSKKTPRNKRIASLLAGASLSALSLVGGTRSAAAAPLLITSPNSGNNFVISSPQTAVIITSNANIPGDVINNTTISSQPVGVLIQN